MPTIARITTAANTKTLNLSTSGLMVRALRDGMEIREKVQRAGDQQRAVGRRERAPTGQCGVWLGDRLDVVEVSMGAGGELVSGERTAARGGGGHEPASQRGELAQDGVHVLVHEKRGHEDGVDVSERAREVGGPGRVVGAVPDLAYRRVRAHLVAARETKLLVTELALPERSPEKRPRRGAGKRDIRP